MQSELKFFGASGTLTEHTLAQPTAKTLQL